MYIPWMLLWRETGLVNKGITSMERYQNDTLYKHRHKCTYVYIFNYTCAHTYINIYIQPYINT